MISVAIIPVLDLLTLSQPQYVLTVTRPTLSQPQFLLTVTRPILSQPQFLLNVTRPTLSQPKHTVFGGWDRLL